MTLWEFDEFVQKYGNWVNMKNIAKKIRARMCRQQVSFFKDSDLQECFVCCFQMQQENFLPAYARIENSLRHKSR